MQHAVAQLVEALRYNPVGCGSDSRWCKWNLSLTYYFRPQYDPEANSASNRIEYQEYFFRDKGGWCVGLTAFPSSCADCLEFWESQHSESLCVCIRPVQGLIYP